MNTMTDTSALAVFNGLRRGEAAPEWIGEAVTSAWGLNPDRTVITLIAVSENATFRIEMDGVPVSVLRVHRPGHVGDARQIAGELTWVRRLAEEAEVRVPDVVPTASGDLLYTFTDPGGSEWHCVAFAFVAGDILEDFADPRPYYAEIGATTARLHQQVKRWPLPADFTRFSWQLGDMLGETSRWGDWRHADLTPEQAAVLGRAEFAAVAALDGLPVSGDSWGLVHADLRPSNIMIDGGILTVIDFDDCGFSWLLYDFASALSFIEHEPYAPDIAKSWVAGYRTVRPLTETDLAHAAALSMIRRLTMLGWTTTHRADALPAELWDAQVPGSVAVAERYLASPTWLFD
jgi:Ser/Thr protein kinase RdoA (MazF antagonist)